MAAVSLAEEHQLRAWTLGGAGSVVVAHGLSCTVTCGIFSGQGSNLFASALALQVPIHCITREVPYYAFKKKELVLNNDGYVQ